MKINWKCGWENYTSWQLLPFIRVGDLWFFVGWLKFEVGFWVNRS